MDHNRAVDSHAVERYMLSEMSPEERDSFEEHYFTCGACAEDVRTAARFHDGARGYFSSSRSSARKPQEARPPRRWWSLPQLVPLAASVALAGVVVYMAGFEIPELKRHVRDTMSVQPMVSVALLGVTRGADIQRIPRGGDFFGVYFDLPVLSGDASYQYTVTDAREKVAAMITGPSPKADGQVNLLFPRSNFPSGQYTITIREGKAVVSELKFIVE